MAKELNAYTTVELKSIAFDLGRQISLSQVKIQEVYKLLAERDALITDIEVTP